MHYQGVEIFILINDAYAAYISGGCLTQTAAILYGTGNCNSVNHLRRIRSIL